MSGKLRFAFLGLFGDWTAGRGRPEPSGDQSQRWRDLRVASSPHATGLFRYATDDDACEALIRQVEKASQLILLSCGQCNMGESDARIDQLEAALVDARMNRNCEILIVYEEDSATTTRLQRCKDLIHSAGNRNSPPVAIFRKLPKEVEAPMYGRVIDSTIEVNGKDRICSAGHFRRWKDRGASAQFAVAFRKIVAGLEDHRPAAPARPDPTRWERQPQPGA